jgi:hypothetical protein
LKNGHFEKPEKHGRLLRGLWGCEVLQDTIHVGQGLLLRATESLSSATRKWAPSCHEQISSLKWLLKNFITNVQ